MATQLIMCVDDDAAILDLMRDLLEDEGYRGEICREGSKAHDVILKKMPALVLLDLRMEQPDSGLKVLEMLRLDPRTADIPVIVCTADRAFARNNSEHLRSQGYDTLEKPFALDALLDKVRAIIGPPTDSER